MWLSQTKLLLICQNLNYDKQAKNGVTMIKNHLSSSTSFYFWTSV
jgi:hypothetical protein